MKDVLETRQLPGGLTATITCTPDDDATPPWERSDGHGVVTDWVDAAKYDDDLDYRVLVRDRDRARFYDVAESRKIAARDGWGSSVESDFESLRSWCQNEWHYVVVGVELAIDTSTHWAQPNVVGRAYLGGLGSFDEAYVRSTIDELIDEAMADARATLTALRGALEVTP